MPCKTSRSVLGLANQHEVAVRASIVRITSATEQCNPRSTSHLNQTTTVTRRADEQWIGKTASIALCPASSRRRVYDKSDALEQSVLESAQKTVTINHQQPRRYSPKSNDHPTCLPVKETRCLRRMRLGFRAPRFVSSVNYLYKHA